ncbi:MAG: twin-arginine translocase TatA/TatE family subunit [Bdellovibrionaceae bacterium]|nr:twin-arginine translocase TatA/TatE family subunit [Bdellovibrionales bacterium]MCB9253586.1 twin-arginine translocase TatA/TatE family subunit [Pseudobdellovibrionaceae bacterium]
MFNLGLPEILVISVAALLVFGPKRLPELAKGLGKGIRDFKKALEGGDEKKQIEGNDNATIDVGHSESQKASADEPNPTQKS